MKINTITLQLHIQFMAAVAAGFRTFGVYFCLSQLPWERKQCEFGYPLGNQQRRTSGLVAKLFL